MTEKDVYDLIQIARDKILSQVNEDDGITLRQIARKSSVTYNALKKFLNGTTNPQIDTFFKILLASGLSPADIESEDGKLVRISKEELPYVQTYKRLDDEYQIFIKMAIDLCSVKQKSLIDALPDKESGKRDRTRDKSKRKMMR